MASLSIRDAARQAGVSRSSILRAIQSGRISAPRKDDGGYAIDPAELFRVFEPRPAGHRDEAGPEDVGQTGQGTEPPVTVAEPPMTDARAAALEAEIQALRELVRRLDLDKQELVRRFDQDKQDLKAERDRWAAQAERLALAPPQPSAPPPDAPLSSRGWWPWRRSA